MTAPATIAIPAPTCRLQKIPYATRAEARATERLIRAESGTSRQWAYQCRWCGVWHLTSRLVR